MNTTRSQRQDDSGLAALVVLGVLVGVVGGVGAWLFRVMIAIVHNLAFLGRFSATYDASEHTPSSPWGIGVVVAPVIGALIVVFLVTRFAPEAKGHGVPEVMEAMYHESGVIRPVVVAVKAVASAITIGTGGSVGREGPIVQIGAAWGSTLGQMLRLTGGDVNLLVATGAAAGIAATFNAPLGGLLFSLELLVLAVSPRAVVVLAAGVTAAILIARFLIGSEFAFSVDGLAQLTPVDVGWSDGIGLAVLGIVTGLAGASFIWVLYRSEDRAAAVIVNPYVRHAAAMLFVGLTFYAISGWLGSYTVQGLGYAAITDVLDGAETSVGVLLVLFAAKWMVTTLTLGTGGSGGIFSPSMMMGAMLGGALGHGLAGLGFPVTPLVFVVAGMAGSVAATTGATLTAVVMLTELSGDFGAALPILLVAAIATATRHLVSPETVYTEKLSRRGVTSPTWLIRRVVRPDR